MSIALVSSAILPSPSPSPGTLTTSAIDTRGATLIVVQAASLNYQANSVSDSRGNTWTALTSINSAITYTRLYYCVNPSTSASHTFTTAWNSSTYPSMQVAAFSGVAASGAFDQQSVNSGLSSTTIQPGSITPVANNELVVFANSSANAGATVSSVSVGTITNNSGGTPGNSVPLCMAYLVQSTATAVNPTFNLSGTAGQLVAAMATFKANVGISRTSKFFFLA